MKILQAVHAFPPSQGGIEHHVYHLSRQLAELGNEVVVITTRDKGTKPDEEVGGIRVKRLFAINFPFFSAARLPLGACLAMIRENVDIYASHGYGSIMPLFAAIAAALKGKPFVFTLHGYPEVHGKKRIFYYLYRFFIAPIFLAVAKKVIVVSKTTAWKIEQEVKKEKIVYIPNGIDDDFDCDLDYENKNNITYVGRLDEDKGVDVLIRAFAEVRRANPELALQLVGKDEGVRSKLETLANSLNVKLIFTEVPYEKMPAVYCDSKAIVLPSKYEGFSLVWLEAMASGRAMFSTPVGEAPYLFEQAYEQNKDLFLFSDEKELVEKLQKFLKNQSRYKKIIERAKYTIKEEYSWENVARQTANVYREAGI
ncbi:MAG: glycosyltransferase family 4 protein [Candidatus Bilamarchaeaceae archaeon]